ncbi:TetR/AcrR family transcriptional regulator [Celeribacter sp. ULVN23_4]
MSKGETADLDHRTRIGQARREKTHERLCEAAIMVFAERGLKGTVIDHVVRQAGVSRGTFYNYFDTIEEVLEAARLLLKRELISLVKATTDFDRPPAERMAYGIHAFIGVARQNQMFLEFTARLGRHGYSYANFLRETAPGLIDNAIETGEFRPVPETLFFDVLEGGVIAVLRRLMEGEDVDIAAFVAAMLRVLGVSYEKAEAVAALPVEPPVPEPNSLLSRANATWSASH